MADKCIFCGKDAPFWKGDVLSCGGVNQPVCFECRDQYIKIPLLQRARLALETGRARSPEKIQEFLDQEAEKAVREAQRQERQRETVRCCGQEMTRVDEVAFLRRSSWIQEYTDNMVMFRCELCGQIKFFDAAFLGGASAEQEKEELVTCPVCGKEHSPLVGCPRCAVRGAQERRTTYAPKPKKDKRPPWEK